MNLHINRINTEWICLKASIVAEAFDDKKKKGDGRPPSYFVKPASPPPFREEKRSDCVRLNVSDIIACYCDTPHIKYNVLSPTSKCRQKKIPALELKAYCPSRSLTLQA